MGWLFAVVARAPPVAYLLAMTAPQQARESTPTMASAHDKILIVDFGSQVTQLIARRVREEGVYSEIVPFQKAEAAFDEMKPKAVILSGGPASVTWKEAPRAHPAVFAFGVPVLGICYGQQTMCEQLGGKVESGAHHEFGRAFVEVTGDCALFSGVWSRPAREQAVLRVALRGVRARALGGLNQPLRQRRERRLIEQGGLGSLRKRRRAGW